MHRDSSGRREVHIQRNREARSRNYCGCGKSSKAFLRVLSGMQIAYFLLRVALPYFATLSNKRYEFRKEICWTLNCIFIFSTFFFRNISHFRKNSARCYKCS